VFLPKSKLTDAMPPSLIATWLEESSHESIDDPETLVLLETRQQDAELEAYLSKRLVEHRTALRVARDMTNLLGWETVRARLTPSLIQVRHGDFGEMLAAEILEEFGGLTVPVRKVRYQIHADQTLVGADVVALELDGERVAGLHFAEAKFRTTGDTSAASAAHEQLARWHRDEFAQILMFVGARLEESDPDLYASFFQYLSDSSERIDKFQIVLVWEIGQWTETIINNLPVSPDILEPLTVRIALIEGLADLTARAYQRMVNVVDE
jgi:Cap4 SAVED domain